MFIAYCPFYYVDLPYIHITHCNFFYRLKRKLSVSCWMVPGTCNND